MFRGQTVHDKIDPKTRQAFFSVSLDKEIAEDFANGGYLFVIHLKPGVQYINVTELVPESSSNSRAETRYDFENEYLIRGGGMYREISRRQERKYMLIEVEYSNIVGGAGSAGNAERNTKINTKKNNNRNRRLRTRKVSKKNLKQRALNEGLSENMINNNILQMYLNHNEFTENN